MRKHQSLEGFIACASFFAAVILSFTAMLLSDNHTIDSSVLMMCAQFLLLTATIFGLDYQILKRISERK